MAAGGTPRGSATTRAIPMLFAEREGTALAVACAPNWNGASAGFVGISDGWQDLAAHKTMTWRYDRAENGNVALIGEVDLARRRRPLRARAGLRELRHGSGASSAREPARRLRSRARVAYVDEWTAWQQRPGAARIVRDGRGWREPARPCCAVTRRSGFRARSSPACRSRGAMRRATTTSAAITWSGRAISWRPPVRCSRPAPATTPAACSTTCA